jgi:class 3 adenylate cyclase
MTETRNLTVMFTDIKGFTKKTALKEREDIEKFLDLHEKLITPIFKEYKGRVVKTIGDAFMVVFESPTNAVLCGMKIQDMLKEYIGCKHVIALSSCTDALFLAEKFLRQMGMDDAWRE